jgi:hypothetical protein
MKSGAGPGVFPLARFGLRAVRSTFVTNASNHTAVDASSGSAASRQEVHAQIHSHAGAQQFADLRVGLIAPQCRVQFHQHQFRHP